MDFTLKPVLHGSAFIKAFIFHSSKNIITDQLKLKGKRSLLK